MYTAYLVTDKSESSECFLTSMLLKYGLSTSLISLIRVDLEKVPTRLLDNQFIIFDVEEDLSSLNNLRRSYSGKTWNINSQTNPLAAWELIYIQNFVLKHQPNILEAKKKFDNLFHLLMLSKPRYLNLLGTGPFLDKIENLDFSDSISIGANTIVKNVPTLNMANVKILVAGDALYHFSFTRHAVRFREDLRIAFKESDIYFVYPAVFDCFVRREFSDFHHRLIPIPIGNHFSILNNLRNHFYLPSLPNVLGLLLLPLATNFSTHIRLLGFDGRSPFDTGFWSNSAKHSHPDLVKEMQIEYTAFFESHVPLSDPLKYQKSTADKIGEEIKLARDKGWKINLIHPSWNAGLNWLYDQDEVYSMRKF